MQCIVVDLLQTKALNHVQMFCPITKCQSSKGVLDKTNQRLSRRTLEALEGLQALLDNLALLGNASLNHSESICMKTSEVLFMPRAVNAKGVRENIQGHDYWSFFGLTSYQQMDLVSWPKFHQFFSDFPFLRHNFIQLQK